MIIFKPAAKITLGDITPQGEIFAIEFQRGLFGENEFLFLYKENKRAWVAVPEKSKLKIVKFKPLFFVFQP